MTNFTQYQTDFSAIDRINQPGTEDPILFYPKEFYPFDNFSSFQVIYKDKLYPTSEHAYQAAKFLSNNMRIAEKIRGAPSAHDAQALAKLHADARVSDWQETKRGIMKQILYCKLNQHPYVIKKLMETGNRIIIEDSRRDAQRGRGADKNGKNMLGELRMEIREEIQN